MCVTPPAARAVGRPGSARVDRGFDAVILAGGPARRLDGASKPAIELAGRTLLDRVLDAVREARWVAVVGPRLPTARPVHWRREQPPGAGPVAAIAAGLVDRPGGDGSAAADSPLVVVLAADLPHVAPALPRLLSGLVAQPGADAAVLRQVDDRLNALVAAWRTEALHRALALVAPHAGVPARSLLTAAKIVEVPDTGGWSDDCDTWADIDAAGRRLSEETP